MLQELKLFSRQIYRVHAYPLRPLAGKFLLQPLSHRGQLQGHGGQDESELGKITKEILENGQFYLTYHAKYY